MGSVAAFNPMKPRDVTTTKGAVSALFDQIGGIKEAMFRLENRSVRILIKGSGPHLRMGILQVTFVGEINKGYDLATKATGEVAAHFPADLVLNAEDIEVRITKDSDVAPGMRDGADWVVPVSIYYECFASSVPEAALYAGIL